MSVVTRFPPSPTGYLHIGSARTALFNWLFARHHGGRFRLRIEDTDRARSTQEAVDAIVEGLRWLELDWDDEIVFQSRNADRHTAVAEELLARGRAYRCYASPEELAEMRAAAKSAGKPVLYDRRWRDRDPSEAPAGVRPVIRIKMPLEGETSIDDLVQGTVRVDNTQLDDFVLLRADGTPTYMLSVVVDDHDMGMTHIIRGDDHLNNAFRQYHLFKAMDWPIPAFAHIPLIHGADGQKLSKRHGAVGVEAYRELGFLPEAMRNYLLRLGWSHGDDEIISTEQAVAWFGLEAVGRSPARFDMDRLENLNAHYLREAPDRYLMVLMAPLIEREIGRPLSQVERARLEQGLPGLKPRARTLVELAQSAMFYVVPPRLPLANPKAAKLLEGDAPALLADLTVQISAVEPWNAEAIETTLREAAEHRGLGLGKLAQPLRAALTGSNASPGVFEVMAILGRDAVLERIAAAANGN